MSVQPTSRWSSAQAGKRSPIGPPMTSPPKDKSPPRTLRLPCPASKCKRSPSGESSGIPPRSDRRRSHRSGRSATFPNTTARSRPLCRYRVATDHRSSAWRRVDSVSLRKTLVHIVEPIEDQPMSEGLCGDREKETPARQRVVSNFLCIDGTFGQRKHPPQ